MSTAIPAAPLAPAGVPPAVYARPPCQPRLAAGLVAMEGLDATGKSGIGGLVALVLGAETFHTPSGDFEPVRNLVHDRSGPEGLLFYLASCAHAYGEFLRSRAPLAVMDRFWFSSLVHHGWKNSLAPDALGALAGWVMEALPVPTLTIFLHARRDVRLGRLSTRTGRHRDLVPPGLDEYWLQAARAVERVLPDGSVTWMDTSAITTEAAALRLCRATVRRLRDGAAARSVPVLALSGNGPAADAAVRGALDAAVRRGAKAVAADAPPAADRRAKIRLNRVLRGVDLLVLAGEPGRAPAGRVRHAEFGEGKENGAAPAHGRPFAPLPDDAYAEGARLAEEMLDLRSAPPFRAAREPGPPDVIPVPVPA